MLPSGSQGASDNRTQPSNEERRFVSAVGPNDVQLGRGRPVVTSEGNKRFRRLILDNRPEYTSSGRHAHKDAIARQILLTIRERGGSFLRKLESASERLSFGLSADAQAWVVVDEDSSLLKVKQALREQESSGKSDGSPSPTPPRKRRKNPETSGASAPNVATSEVSVTSPGQRAAVSSSSSTVQPSESSRHAEATRSALDSASTGRAKMPEDEVASVDSTSPPKDALELLFQLKHSTLADSDTWHQQHPHPPSEASSESPSDSDRKLPARAAQTTGEAQQLEEALLTMQPMTAATTVTTVADGVSETKSEIEGAGNRSTDPTTSEQMLSSVVNQQKRSSSHQSGSQNPT
jgi:hypothetical protein